MNKNKEDSSLVYNLIHRPIQLRRRSSIITQQDLLDDAIVIYELKTLPREDHISAYDRAMQIVE